MELPHPGDGGLVVLGLFTYTGDCKCKPALRKKNWILFDCIYGSWYKINAQNISSTTLTLQEKTELLNYIVDR